MDPKRTWNLGYRVLALMILLLFQSIWQTASETLQLPYSEFEKALSEGRIAQVSVTNSTLIGRLKAAEGNKTTLVALAQPGTDPVHKVSIIPRGIGALGYTIQRPTEDRFVTTRPELEQKIAILLGGRAAEKLVFGVLSTGAADDLAKATDMARDMVTRYGMGEAAIRALGEELRRDGPAAVAST